MKTFALALVITVGMLFSAPGMFAQTVYTYPAEQPVFSIAFPDDWSVELDEGDAGVIALSPDEELEIDIWPLEQENVADDVRAALMTTAGEIDAILADYITGFNAGEPETLEINDITFVEISGTATYIKSNSAATISVDFFSPDGKTVFALIYWGNPASDAEYADDLAAIVNSIQAP